MPPDAVLPLRNKLCQIKKFGKRLCSRSHVAVHRRCACSPDDSLLPTPPASSAQYPGFSSSRSLSLCCDRYLAACRKGVNFQMPVAPLVDAVGVAATEASQTAIFRVWRVWSPPTRGNPT